MSESAIQSLLDMGITREVAIEALAKTNGDIENSVNYIFSGELPQQGPPPAPEEIPEGGEKEPDSESDIPENPEFIEQAPPSEDEAADQQGVAVSPRELIASQLKSRPEDPLVVRPASGNALFENYFALFCLAVGLGFPHYFLEPDFQDLTYCQDWYRGQFLKPAYRIKFDTNDDVSIVSQETLTSQDNLVLQPELLWQFQKFLAVQNSPQSRRKYVTARYLTKVLEPQVVEKLNNSDHLHEALPSFIKSLANDVELCPGARSVKELFISTAYYKPASEPDPIETLVSLLHFMPEEYDTNIYKMFNALLYPEESEDSEMDDIQNSLGKLAPMITIVFDEMDEATEQATLPHGVDVPLEFYPQLYTEEAKNLLIKEVIKLSADSQAQARSILRNLNDLKSFQGKQIHSFLNSTLDFISRDTSGVSEQPDVQELVESLQEVKQQLGSKKTEKMAQYKAVSHRLNNELNLSHPELGIIQRAKDLGIIDEPYLLTSAVISASNYFIRQNNGQWYHAVGRSNSEHMDVTKTDASTVSNAIRLHTRSASESPLMFTYFKSSAIDTEALVKEAVEHNKGAKLFAEQDQEHINTMSATEEENLIDL
ncbi:LAQU0S04e02388g1_1 [Lachancea quebecensis]|uniref:LAQU0S04e02388g1_1 n=1 Tax=Lachancea quebecensis TaxID=1654605 RepID=A0A0P1KR12_9SACH|nr:LAQU0S04e02388g1_1 [Lachancea quebecensis]